MKKYIFFSAIFAYSISFAGDYSNFLSIDSKSAKAFAGDIGSIMGGGISYTSRSLGFSGFDIAYKASYQLKPSSNNSIMPKERAFGINYVQVELGMPYRIDAFVRSGFGDRLAVVGGGVKYGLWKIRDEMYQVNGLITLDSHMANNINFYAIQYGANIIFSMNCGIIRPYIVGGFDSTRLKIQNALDPAIVNKNFYETRGKVGAGLRFKMKWVNMAASYNYSHGNDLLDGAFSIRF